MSLALSDSDIFIETDRMHSRKLIWWTSEGRQWNPNISLNTARSNPHPTSSNLYPSLDNSPHAEHQPIEAIEASPTPPLASRSIPRLSPSNSPASSRNTSKDLPKIHSYRLSLLQNTHPMSRKKCLTSFSSPILV